MDGREALRPLGEHAHWLGWTGVLRWRGLDQASGGPDQGDYDASPDDASPKTARESLADGLIGFLLANLLLQALLG